MAYHIEILSWLGAIPNVVWSGICASLITLSGVMFSDWRNTKRLLLQQQFSEQESGRARTLALRKEVYLPVATALGQTFNHLFSLGTVDNKAGERPSSLELGEALSKIAMVAETETAVLAQSLAVEISSAYMALSLAAVPGSRARADSAIHSDLRKKTQEDLDRLMLEINKFLESAKTDQVVFDALCRRRDSVQAELQRQWQLEVDALERASRESIIYLRAAIEIVEPITKKTKGMLSLIRKELGVQTDLAEFNRALDEGRDRMISGLRATIDVFERRSGPIQPQVNSKSLEQV